MRNDAVPSSMASILPSVESQAASQSRTLVCRVVSQGDHGMNQCLRSLACVVAMAALALVPTELAAKSQPSAPNKTHEAKAGKQRHAAAGKHGKHAEAKRKSKKQAEEPADKPAPPAL